jgi:hypothetical protein
MADAMDLIDEIWDAVLTQHSRDVCDWDALESVVSQGLGTWDDESLIDEAKRFGIDVSEYIEERV